METEKLVEKGSFWFAEAVTSYARDIDFLFNSIYYFSIFLLVSVFGTALYFVFKYRKTDKNQIPEKQVAGNTKLEIVWTVIPLILVMTLFTWGFRDYIKQSIIPSDSLEIKVIGQKWNWIYFYPNNGGQSTELVVPVGRNVKLIMSSKDILHSYFIPNFRIKRDLMPGQYSTLWFNVEKKGRYQVFCAEYCGDGHSTMGSTIKVVDDNEYQAFVEKMADNQSIPPAELGEKLYVVYGCKACHSLDGTEAVGPSWKNLFNREVKFADVNKETVKADDNYIRESIVEPGKKTVAGYQNTMPSFSYLSDVQIDGLIEYIKTLSGSSNTSENTSENSVNPSEKKDDSSNGIKGSAISGKKLFNTKGCVVCHPLGGANGIGPSLNGIFDTEEREFADGSHGKVDEQYIKNSINEPGKNIVKGYNNVMTLFKLSEQEVDDLVEYLKNLK